MGRFLSTSPKLKLLSVHAAMDDKDKWIARETDHYISHMHGLRSADCFHCKSQYNHEHALDKEDSCCLELARALPELYEVRFKRLYSEFDRRGEDGQRSIFISRRGSNVELSRVGVSCL